MSESLVRALAKAEFDRQELYEALTGQADGWTHKDILAWVERRDEYVDALERTVTELRKELSAFTSRQP